MGSIIESCARTVKPLQKRGSGIGSGNSIAEREEQRVNGEKESRRLESGARMMNIAKKRGQAHYAVTKQAG